MINSSEEYAQLVPQEEHILNFESGVKIDKKLTKAGPSLRCFS
jgi:hypothetical protein